MDMCIHRIYTVSRERDIDAQSLEEKEIDVKSLEEREMDA